VGRHLAKLASEHKIGWLRTGGKYRPGRRLRPPARITAKVVISHRRMDRIRDGHDAASTPDLRAGVVVAEIRAAGRQRGSTGCFRCRLGADGSCTIGGTPTKLPADAAFGVWSGARDGARAGSRIAAGAKSSTGLSKLKKRTIPAILRNLFIGAEGTLGIITAGERLYKLFPKTATTGGDDAERDLGTDEEIAQIVAGIVFFSFEAVEDSPCRQIRDFKPARAPFSRATPKPNCSRAAGALVERVCRRCFAASFVGRATAEKGGGRETARSTAWQRLAAAIETHAGPSQGHGVCWRRPSTSRILSSSRIEAPATSPFYYAGGVWPPDPGRYIAGPRHTSADLCLLAMLCLTRLGGHYAVEPGPPQPQPARAAVMKQDLALLGDIGRGFLVGPPGRSP